VHQNFFGFPVEILLTEIVFNTNERHTLNSIKCGMAVQRPRLQGDLIQRKLPACRLCAYYKMISRIATQRICEWRIG
jgi:hypothetical protein